MEDRELLELAGKAAGVRKDKNGSFYDDTRLGKEWLPFYDDTDALRLAVKLGMNLSLPGPNTVFVVCDIGNSKVILENATQDPYEATRRAIVRAASELAKAKIEWEE